MTDQLVHHGLAEHRRLARADHMATTGAAARLERIVPAAARQRHGLPRALTKATGALLILAFWWIGSARGWIAPDIFPSPGVMLATFGELLASGEFAEAMSLSVRRVAIGFTLGLAVGGLLALASGLFRLGEDLVDAPMQMIRTLPWAGLIPLLIIWFGIDEQPKIAPVAFAATFPIYLNTFAGIRNVDRTLVEAAHTLGLRGFGLVTNVILPGALPNALVGLRYALGSAWLALVFAEQVNAEGGLGHLIVHAREVYRIDIIVLCLVIYAVLGLGVDLIVRLLEKGLLQWRPSFSGT